MKDEKESNLDASGLQEGGVNLQDSKKNSEYAEADNQLIYVKALQHFQQGKAYRNVKPLREGNWSTGVK